MTLDRPRRRPAVRDPRSGAPRRPWAAWFDGLTLTPESDGTTVIRGPVVDQAALHGLLQKLRDIGLPLVSVTRVDPTSPTSQHRASITTSTSTTRRTT